MEKATNSESFPIHIVLFQPEIPPNTGNIGRTCVALGAKLWIVRPASFRLDSAQLRRAGMDYWKDLAWECVDSWEQLTERLPDARFWLVTKFGEHDYGKVEYQYGDVLVFGNESSGLPDRIHEQYAERRVVVPMPGPVRCLNLATTAGIVAYHVARQIGFFDAPNCTIASEPAE